MKEAVIRKARTESRRNKKITQFERERALGLSRLFTELLKLPENHSHYYDHGYRSGELHESNLWQIAANLDNARPFSVRETIDIPDFHVGLLLDCSGSMASPLSSLMERGRVPATHGDRTCVMTGARILALAMGMSMSEREGLHLSICGHTEEMGMVQLIMAKRA